MRSPPDRRPRAVVPFVELPSRSLLVERHFFRGPGTAGGDAFQRWGAAPQATDFAPLCTSGGWWALKPEGSPRRLLREMCLPRTDGGCGREVAQHRPPFPPPAAASWPFVPPQGGLRSKRPRPMSRRTPGRLDALPHRGEYEESVGSFQPPTPSEQAHRSHDRHFCALFTLSGQEVKPRGADSHAVAQTGRALQQPKWPLNLKTPNPWIGD